MNIHTHIYTHMHTHNTHAQTHAHTHEKGAVLEQPIKVTVFTLVQSAIHMCMVEDGNR